MKHFRIICAIIFIPLLSWGQEDIILTKDFTKKLSALNLQYQEPNNVWLHPHLHEKDDFGIYDMTLVSDDDSLEVRLLFNPLGKSSKHNLFPHAHFVTTVSNMATNSERASIIVQEIPNRAIQKRFNADWGLRVEFVPKASLLRKKGHGIVLFRENTALVYCFILYDSKRLPSYVDMLMSFQALN